MAEYIEREEAKKLLRLEFGGVTHAVIACRILDAVPAADVVEIVRCKNCVAAVTDEDGVLRCNYDWNHVDADFYCGIGEKRADK